MPAVLQVSGPPLAELSNTDYAAGSWYNTVLGSFSSQTVAFISTVVVFVPFVPRHTHTFTGLGWYHNSGAQGSQNLRLGVYGSVKGKPSGNALVDTGSIATTAAAAFRSATGLSVTLIGGQMYYLAGISDASLTGLAWSPVISSAYPMAWGQCGLIDPGTAFAAAISSTALGGFTQSASYGALPTVGTLVDGIGSAIRAPGPVIVIQG